jgi:hypothetical protein
MDRKTFWENKIIRWEKAKYDEWRLFDINRSLKFRQRLSIELMKPVIKGSVVVEYGCGTARLMDTIMDLGAKKYIGVDSSTSAIQIAQHKVKSYDVSKTDLVCSPIENLDKIPADLSFSLGLMDWVDPKEIGRLSAPLFLHSFSEIKPGSFEQIAHRAYWNYRQWIGGEAHRPTYYRKEDLQKLFQRSRIKFYHNPKLSFGGFIHNLL